ncbi:MAG: HD domain-containing protein [Methanoregulaceae archaeon]
MKIIKDPVHGYVEIDEALLPLLDDPVVQRLRYIRQLGFSYLVYPGANHTRFEHALGAMHLGGLVSRQIGLCDHDRLVVSAAALLHDIGHGPFSHASEPLIEELLGRGHADIRQILEGGGLSQVLEQTGIDQEDIISLISGNHPLAGIIHGSLDVDRMDYLLRDAHYTGAPYGTVDTQRLIRHIVLTPDGIALDENGVNAAESLLIARTLMRSTVYYHHVSRIAHSMFVLAALSHLASQPESAVLPFLRDDDYGCLSALLKSPEPVARDLTQRLYHRRLFKRALYVGREQVNVSSLQGKRALEGVRDVSRKIADHAGVPDRYVLLDIPDFPGLMAIEVQVKSRHALAALEEVSPLVTTLNETRREQWRLGVYTLPEYRDRVALAATEILHVRKPTLQDKLTL